MSSDLNIWQDPLALDLDMDPTTEHQLGLISVWEGGQRIGRQSGGHACLPCETQGGYVALLDDCADLTHYFIRRCIEDRPIDDEARDVLLQYLLKADTARLLELPHGHALGCQAFASVTIVGLKPTWPDTIKLGPGVLTWPNGD